MMLEKEIKLHRFAGILPEHSFTKAGGDREAVMAADQNIVVRCFGDDLSDFIHNDFHGLVQGAGPRRRAMVRI